MTDTDTELTDDQIRDTGDTPIWDNVLSEYHDALSDMDVLDDILSASTDGMPGSPEPVDPDDVPDMEPTDPPERTPDEPAEPELVPGDEPADPWDNPEQPQPSESDGGS